MAEKLLLPLLLLALPIEKPPLLLPASSVMVPTEAVVARRRLLGRLPWATPPSKGLGGVAGGIGAGALRARCGVLN